MFLTSTCARWHYRRAVFSVNYESREADCAQTSSKLVVPSLSRNYRSHVISKGYRAAALTLRVRPNVNAPRWLAPPALFLLSVALHAGTLRGGFVWDDRPAVVSSQQTPRRPTKKSTDHSPKRR